MRPLAPDRTELALPDGKPPLTPQQAAVEANRCLGCTEAPCIRACPTSIDIPGFIRRIATGNVRGAARVILDANIFGQGCARVCPVEVLCVGDCVYNHLDLPPIQIGKLQRYATDAAAEAGWSFYTAGADTGRSVGLIGAGPASLAAAHRLRRFGHRVTIYDRREVVGGLHTTGVAPYKMPAADAVAEAERVLAIGGVELALGVAVPAALGWEALLARHDALFLGFGLGADSVLALPGAGLPGVEGAVDFIERMKLGQVDLSAVRRAVVVGGGNTAMDAVRELAGLGVPEVTLAYRGDEAGMSGYAHEWAAAKQLGVRGRFRVAPVGFAGDARVEGLRVQAMDAAKRPIPGTEETLGADLVLLAIGQARLDALVAGLPGVETAGGRIVTDAAGRTGHPRVFAGGDCRNGGREVVNAVAEGRDAAVAMHELLGSLSEVR
jgi:dihydropyrimidine dehydrogenase (NAD+) subunit PreT